MTVIVGDDNEPDAFLVLNVLNVVNVINSLNVLNIENVVNGLKVLNVVNVLNENNFGFDSVEGGGHAEVVVIKHIAIEEL